ncbi:precorrin-6A synthase (deacetylating) [Motilibacter deserti]|uniref:Precorrin-6A synthase (Deacetylating) n=1 Tax=Motilibacter deserti TaxID=2714956 RepID=A0ABX0GW44_9ACTN|nr:precorrin-6A synthase (deacetylating) [Motilibacter deserti]
MRNLLVIGIGAGDPDYVTIQAVKALNRVDVFFVLDKGEAKHDLVALRQEILERHVERPYRVVHGRDPERDVRSGPYAEAVEDWRRRRADVCERMVLDELADGECGAFLVWGDPSLYDSTLGIVEDIVTRGNVELDYEVVPGISSVSALAARHRTVLNRVGGAFQVTTGRRVSEGLPEDVDDVAVMLDVRPMTRLPAQGVDVYWGAYVGTPDEVLVAGPLEQVAARIDAVREEARARKGWIMDTYLLRRHVDGDARG